MLDEAQTRRDKLAKLIKLGIDPYPVNVERQTVCADALRQFDAWAADKSEHAVAGRLMTIRVHGAMIFADLMDETGKIQILLKEDETGAKLFAAFRDLIDPADIIEATGTLFQTKRGEKTLQVKTWRLLSKALLPLPEKFHGLKDVETRYRQRELDLLSDPDVRRNFIVRSQLVSQMRAFLNERGFLEVETPVLQPIPGGANAKPFITHHNALDVDFYMRIAPELYLKRLLVGGFEKVFEIARCFRNEGIDFAHNPEFTQIELYWAFVGKDRFLSFIEEMIRDMVQKALGGMRVESEKGMIDFSAAIPRLTFRQAIVDACGIDINKMKSPKDIQAAAKKAKLDVDFSQCVGMDEYEDELHKKTARAKLTGPVWVMDYPLDMMPLANKSDEDATKSATAQLIVHGMEVVKAFYYELNNPVDQRERFLEQRALAEKGSEVAQRMDTDFLRAMEHGMPPAAGMGMGIDRLTSLLTGSHNLKEVILFPTLRPEK